MDFKVFRFGKQIKRNGIVYKIMILGGGKYEDKRVWKALQKE